MGYKQLNKINYNKLGINKVKSVKHSLALKSSKNNVESVKNDETGEQIHTER